MHRSRKATAGRHGYLRLLGCFRGGHNAKQGIAAHLGHEDLLVRLLRFLDPFAAIQNLRDARQPAGLGSAAGRRHRAPRSTLAPGGLAMPHVVTKLRKRPRFLGVTGRYCRHALGIPQILNQPACAHTSTSRTCPKLHGILSRGSNPIRGGHRHRFSEGYPDPGYVAPRSSFGWGAQDRDRHEWREHEGFRGDRRQVPLLRAPALWPPAPSPIPLSAAACR